MGVSDAEHVCTHFFCPPSIQLTWSVPHFSVHKMQHPRGPPSGQKTGCISRTYRNHSIATHTPFPLKMHPKIARALEWSPGQNHTSDFLSLLTQQKKHSRKFAPQSATDCPAHDNAKSTKCARSSPFPAEQRRLLLGISHYSNTNIHKTTAGTKMAASPLRGWFFILYSTYTCSARRRYSRGLQVRKKQVFIHSRHLYIWEPIPLMYRFDKKWICKNSSPGTVFPQFKGMINSIWQIIWRL